MFCRYQAKATLDFSQTRVMTSDIHSWEFRFLRSGEKRSNAFNMSRKRPSLVARRLLPIPLNSPHLSIV
jgi:hypothetical protein